MLSIQKPTGRITGEEIKLPCVVCWKESGDEEKKLVTMFPFSKFGVHCGFCEKHAGEIMHNGKLPEYEKMFNL